MLAQAKKSFIEYNQTSIVFQVEKQNVDQQKHIKSAHAALDAPYSFPIYLMF